LVFITEKKSVYSAVRAGSLNKTVCHLSLKGLKTLQIDILFCDRIDIEKGYLLRWMKQTKIGFVWNDRTELRMQPV
jgi:hypothetical protein